MENRLYRSIYRDLLKAAEKDALKLALQEAEEKSADSPGTAFIKKTPPTPNALQTLAQEKVTCTTTLLRLLHLAMHHDQYLEQEIEFKYHDKLEKRVISCASDKRSFTRWCNRYGQDVFSSIFIYDKTHETWVSTSRESISTEIDSIFSQEIIDSLPYRIALIKTLLRKLEGKLHYRFHHLNTFDYFLHRMRYPATTASMKKEVLVWASRTGALELVTWLCQHKVSLHAQQIALEAALESNQREIISYLYQQGVPLGEKHLASAAQAGDIEVVQWMCKQGVRCDAKAFALEVACNEKQWDIAKHLYHEGVPLHDKHFASFASNLIETQAVETMQLLIERELCSDPKNNQIAMLTLRAMEKSQDEIVSLCLEYLTQKVINRQLSLTDNLEEVLLCATRNGYTGVMRILLQGGMSVNTCDKKGQTLLSIATHHGYVGTINCLEFHDASLIRTVKEKPSFMSISLKL